jgi:hypothetical protein
MDGYAGTRDACSQSPAGLVLPRSSAPTAVVP